MGVGEDFATFRDNYQITQEKIGSISYRYKRITRQLNTDFRDNTSDTVNSMYVGSYGRDTAARGLSDLDMAFNRHRIAVDAIETFLCDETSRMESLDLVGWDLGLLGAVHIPGLL